jgi:hypothetical protein
MTLRHKPIRPAGRSIPELELATDRAIDEQDISLWEERLEGLDISLLTFPFQIAARRLPALTQPEGGPGAAKPSTIKQGGLVR